VDVLVLFLGGDVVERNGELERAGGLLNLALEVSRRGHQLRRAERREVALFQLALNAAKLFAESVYAVGGGREPLFAQRFEFDGMEVLDLELVFAAPGDERGFSDVEFNHEPGIGPALGTEFNETLDSLWRMHKQTAFLWNLKQAPRRANEGAAVEVRERWKISGGPVVNGHNAFSVINRAES